MENSQEKNAVPGGKCTYFQDKSNSRKEMVNFQWKVLTWESKVVSVT